MPASRPTSSDPAFIARLTDIRARMAAASQAAGRDPAAAILTAVSKTQPPEAIDAALVAGLRVFGENRVQEAQGRWGGRRAGLPDLELRLIGPLQSNKAEDAVALFDVIETLDRDKLVGALTAAAAKVGRSPRLLVQVNTGEEPQKAGVAPRDADALIARARAEGLTVEGLMAIPPADEEPILHFALLARIAERNGLSVLSMGMSGDFEAAIRLGATHVRIGSALFGERNPLPAPSSL
ncbi:YggS family pyridoxal phosphate-dependent enzyme [Brevundimonas sp. LM2]|uniref:YggS family pyridoxal phosphate-dependent enzyme n=1 Tax=Brevundimonas sp. LM2 TaxID=1938605 RepID=UPI00210FFB71|nr:YggS family pyridoxal phosphate-dependent enzyme [Brevundimonas sp. LM2]